ncbi:enolase C-terminal domain-like protein [Thermomonospora cellulosilytica]|uniref:O-succinylbenzoate synthase n=1 Tax=Thermomonospora cellulosilytica TaxID=1411118 RepID=A0A7W3RAC6_9ACTN|nr:enolase C-terminal domain-like protein [Thermomonospora cellulosilytica]MBA9005160.1 O-succinylbenzoate synthase [Thermomonospora cellulosilytica]
MPLVQGCDAFRVAMPRGRRPQSVLVRLTAEDGTVGWGEAAHPDPDDTTWADISERLAPALLGLPWERPEDVSATTEFGTRRAAAAVDIACWDLWCRIRGLPLAHALGGTRTSIVTGARIDTGSFGIETLVGRVNQVVGGGHTRVTLTIRPGWDIEPVRAVRAAYPALAMVVDAGGRYTESREHLEALQALDAYGPVAIERPFPTGDLAAHARLQQRVSTALCPEIGDLDMLDAAIRMAAGRALDLDIARFGGLTAARGAHDRAYAAGWDVWCGGSGAFGIGQAAAVAMAGLPGCTLPSDVTDPAGGPAFVSPPVRSSGGVVGVPLTQPGLGHEVDEERIARLATETVRIPA